MQGDACFDSGDHTLGCEINDCSNKGTSPHLARAAGRKQPDEQHDDGDHLRGGRVVH